MHSFICSHQLTRRLDGLQWLVLGLPARHFSGLVGEADSLPIKYTPALWCDWHLSISDFFSFTKCIVQHIGLLVRYQSLCSVLEGSIYCLIQTFSIGGSENVRELVNCFCASCLDCFVQYLLIGLRSCKYCLCWSFNCAVLAVFSFFSLCERDPDFLDALLRVWE